MPVRLFCAILNLRAKKALTEGRTISCVRIENHYPCGISMHDIARFVGIDRSCLCRIFKAGLGVSPARYLHAYRLKKVAEMMERESLSIHEIALSTGFYDVSHFSRVFAPRYGMQPGAYRKMCLKKADKGEE